MENVMRLDLHQLIPRFAPLRLHDPERLARLTHSLHQHGQLLPVVVAESLDPPRWVLIDGYRRLEALRQIGKDLVWVDVWEHSVERLFAQYQQAPKARRERLVENPALFVQAFDTRAQAAEDRHLAEGPEGTWCQDLGVTERILQRLTALAPTLFFPQQDRLEQDRLEQAFARAKGQFQRLDRILAQVLGHDPL